MPPAIPDRVAERAATRYVEVGECYETTYTHSKGSGGYGSIGWGEGGRRFHTKTHRAAWTHWHGPIPHEMTVDHTCRNHACVRREHLRLLTNLDNATDNGKEKARIATPTGLIHHCGEPLVSTGGAAWCRGCKNRNYARLRGRTIV